MATLPQINRELTRLQAQSDSLIKVLVNLPSLHPDHEKLSAELSEVSDRELELQLQKTALVLAAIERGEEHDWDSESDPVDVFQTILKLGKDWTSWFADYWGPAKRKDD